jgi:hypothetical protein
MKVLDGPQTRKTPGRIEKFDPRRGEATVITDKGIRVRLPWELVRGIAPILTVGDAVFLIMSDAGEMLRLQLAR